jgi:cation diffusion facilitator CzcD-associated flavoprotein CzcO
VRATVAGAALLVDTSAHSAGLTRRRCRAQTPVARSIHVAIVGAGVAGLQQARALQKRGIPFTVYEAADDIGGVWRSNYDGYAAQGVHYCPSLH